MARYSATGYLLLTLAPLLVAQRTETLVDVDAVRAVGDPSGFLRTVRVPDNPPTLSCDVLVAGAGAGGFAAALRAADYGHTVCLTEESDWIGGQITAGGVAALDENRFIEISGAPRTYYEMRRRIRDHYRKNFTLSPAAARLENLNPGSCYVSALCFEPQVGVKVLEEMLAGRRPRIRLMLRSKVFALDVDRGAGMIRSALVYRFREQDVVRITPRHVLDATELGDLLPLAGAPYTVGSEAKADTGEPHAAAAANADCVQSFTYTFAIDVRPGENHRVAKVEGYERIRDSQPFSLGIHYAADYGWRGTFRYKMFGDDPPVPNNMSPGPFFSWRRLLDKRNFSGARAPEDLALMNWPRQDYHDESILDRSPADTARILQQAKRVALAFLYWLQTDLERDDGKGRGYPELRLRNEVMGSEDGLSKYPYIRESRRLIPARDRVVEQDVVAEYQQGSRARWHEDSVGTGFYMVDIHPCGANERGRMMMPRPFQIPQQAIMPQKVRNLLAAGKNIGVTHLTNGAFRLHPVEWTVGEAAATLAALRMRLGREPLPLELQEQLARNGVPLVWFDDVPVDHPAFAAIQMAAIRGVYPLSQHDLHASPDAPVSRREAAHALSRHFGIPTTDPIQLALTRGWMAVDHRNWFHADLPLYWTDWREDQFPTPIPPHDGRKTGPVTRVELARRLSGMAATQ